jgi:hypothetical protein
MKLSSIIAARHRIDPPQDLLFTVDTSINGQLFVEFDSALNYSGVIDWGDGSSNTVLSGTGNSGTNHTYSTNNTFQVKVSGTQVPRFRLDYQLNVVSVENLGNVGIQNTSIMFDGCSNLTSANIGDYITSIDFRAFFNCLGLTSATIGNSVTSTGESSFSSCTSLTSVSIGSSVTSIGLQTFAFCSSLTSIIIPSSVTSIGVNAFSMLTNSSSLGSISCLAMAAPALGSSAFNNVLATTIEVPIGATGYGTTYGGLTVNYVL